MSNERGRQPIQVDDQTHQEIRQFAFDSGRSMGSLVSEAWRHYVASVRMARSIPNPEGLGGK